MFPCTPGSVTGDYHRWKHWVRIFSSTTASELPTILPEQRRSLRDIARFLLALATPGAHGIDISEWDNFWNVFMDGLPPIEHTQRGEAHLLRMSRWLRDRYVVSHSTMFRLACASVI